MSHVTGGFPHSLILLAVSLHTQVLSWQHVNTQQKLSGLSWCDAELRLVMHITDHELLDTDTCISGAH